MPTKRSRNVDDTHSVARWLFQAADLGTAQTLILTYPDHDAALRAARALRNFRDRGALAAPGTFEPSTVDPEGNGRGHFDHIEIRVRDSRVELGLRRVVFEQPQAARVMT